MKGIIKYAGYVLHGKTVEIVGEEDFDASAGKLPPIPCYRIRLDNEACVLLPKDRVRALEVVG